MTNEPNPVNPEQGTEGESGSDHPGVELFRAEATQVLTSINAPDAIIPSEAPAEESEHQVEAFKEQEDKEGEGFHTTDGYVVDEAGMLNNFAIEPPMYVEGSEPPQR